MNKKLLSVVAGAALIVPIFTGAQDISPVPPRPISNPVEPADRPIKNPGFPDSAIKTSPNDQRPISNPVEPIDRPIKSPGFLDPAIKSIQEIRNTKREELKDLRNGQFEENKDLRDKVREEQKNNQDQIRAVREEDQKTNREMIESFKTGIFLPVEEFKAFQEKRESMRLDIEAKREEAKQIIEMNREEAKQIIETRREELKQKLEVVKDERKKQVAEKLFDDINKLNVKAIENLAKAADQIEEVLNRILSRSEKALVNGENTTGVIAAGEAAKIAIREARTAIQEQAAKVYSVSVSSEANLKTDMSKVRDSLRSDLEGVKSKVKAARAAVQAAAVSLAQIPKVDELEVSPQPTNNAAGTVEAGSGVEPTEPAVQ